MGQHQARYFRAFFNTERAQPEQPRLASPAGFVHLTFFLLLFVPEIMEVHALENRGSELSPTPNTGEISGRNHCTSTDHDFRGGSVKCWGCFGASGNVELAISSHRISPVGYQGVLTSLPVPLLTKFRRFFSESLFNKTTLLSRRAKAQKTVGHQEN